MFVVLLTGLLEILSRSCLCFLSAPLSLNTWRMQAPAWSLQLPASLLKVSICSLNGTPRSPPCFLGVNSVEMQ